MRYNIKQPTKRKRSVHRPIKSSGSNLHIQKELNIT
uniref:Uncharacterized protein n=1 Tax=Anguilla anguilla TaxID=7936 RepID=A0A0E9WLX9_ANGAN